MTDGPFAETREVLSSYFIVEAEDMDEAVAVASLHPAALMVEAYGFGVEVWLIQSSSVAPVHGPSQSDELSFCARFVCSFADAPVYAASGS